MMKENYSKKAHKDFPIFLTKKEDLFVREEKTK